MSKKTRYFLRIDPESLIGLISMTAAADPDQSSSLVIYMRLLMESAPYGGVIKLDQDNPLDLDRWAHRLNVGEDVLSAALK